MVPQQARQDVGTEAALRAPAQVRCAFFALAVDAVADNAILGAENILATVGITREQAPRGTNPGMASGDYEERT
jgi:hypothetical protein